MHRTLSFLVLALPMVGSAQPPPAEAPVQPEPPAEVVPEETFDMAAVEERPQFPGGEAAYFRYLSTHTRYPQLEMEQGIQGKVWVEFTIDTAGVINHVKVMRGVSPGLDLEAVRVVKAMPRWQPGKMNGKAVPVRYIMPINFSLR